MPVLAGFCNLFSANILPQRCAPGNLKGGFSSEFFHFNKPQTTHRSPLRRPDHPLAAAAGREAPGAAGGALSAEGAFTLRRPDRERPPQGCGPVPEGVPGHPAGQDRRVPT